MATHIGNEGVVKVGVNTVGEITAFSFTEETTVADDSQLSDTWDTHLAGSKRWSGQATAWFDEGDTNGQVAMANGASVSLGLYPEGGSGGDTYASGTATITSREIGNARNGAVPITFQFQGNGALTWATV